MNECRILLIDDTCSDRHLMRAALQKTSRGTELDIAKDGIEAMGILLKKGPYAKSQTPSLIILDLNLPKKSGREVLQELKLDEDLRKIPVVILTSSNSSRERLEMKVLGADFYMVKPFKLEDYYSLISAIEHFGIELAASPDQRVALSANLLKLVA